VRSVKDASEETYTAWFRTLEQDNCFLVWVQLLREVAEELLDSAIDHCRGPACARLARFAAEPSTRTLWEAVARPEQAPAGGMRPGAHLRVLVQAAAH
jgi:hypothetical protein